MTGAEKKAFFKACSLLADAEFISIARFITIMRVVNSNVRTGGF